MSISLEIKDGTPWYLSTNIWTVPGDPSGSPGLPVVGTPCYLFATVTNNGTSSVQDATVRFYWANPSLGFDRSTANLIGQSNVSLSSGASEDVLCLTPWDPTFVNGGHECVLAEAFHTSLDPLPATPVFNVPTDRHVAQRNLSVLMAAKRMFKIVFEIHNPSRKENAFEIVVQKGKLEEFKKLAAHAGKNFNTDMKSGELKNWGFVDAVCPSPEEIKNGNKEIRQLKLYPKSKITKCLIGEVTLGATLIHILQKKEDKIIGGLAALIISD
jgi:hypothetical protein